MDILLMPTVREGFSLSVLEAMASGLPVVASDCSSLPEQIDNGNGGFLCPVGDVNAFAEKINFLADSPKLRREMGEYNRAKVEKMFTLDRMVKEYQELFDEVLDRLPISRKEASFGL
jgi:glycosyltransferase involved in cell wall biosynthesis